MEWIGFSEIGRVRHNRNKKPVVYLLSTHCITMKVIKTSSSKLPQHLSTFILAIDRKAIWRTCHCLSTRCYWRCSRWCCRRTGCFIWGSSLYDNVPPSTHFSKSHGYRSCHCTMYIHSGRTSWPWIRPITMVRKTTSIIKKSRMKWNTLLLFLEKQARR